MKQFKPHLPAEWEHHSGVLISWPTKSTDWYDNLVDAEATYVELIKLITLNNHVYICCYDSDTRQHVQQCCRAVGIPSERFELFTIPYDDTWTRDYGPISLVRRNETVWLNFRFNAWGSKYPYQQDNLLTPLLHQQFSQKIILESINFVLEGGSIECDGDNTVLTTSVCLLDSARNSNLSKKQIEDRLKSSLGVQRILWLDHGHIEGDDTDTHIDTLARFCSPDTITYVQCRDPIDPHFESLSNMAEQLKSFTQTNGQPYNLIPLPLPTPCFNKQGQRLPATYTNFLILNGSVLVPIYGVETDTLALAQLQKCFPKHGVIPVQCRSLLEQFGSLHCITMQIL
ncbi:MAG: agmatine deiminase family protein [Gammaproteobacteria bacterium]|nr:agmatine deiminase family protein [Gammaproteobacteria bacterium]